MLRRLASSDSFIAIRPDYGLLSLLRRRNVWRGRRENVSPDTVFGHVTLTNICNGKITVVPWGNVDWALAFGFSVAGAAIVLLFAVMAVMISKQLKP